MALIEGDFYGKAVRAEIGGKPVKVRIEMEVTEGENKGKRFPYEGKLDEKNIRYTKMAMMAVGWRGHSSKTFASDVAAAAVITSFKVRIAKFTRDDGSISEWSSVDKIGGPPPLAPLDEQQLADVDRWFAEAGDAPANPGRRQSDSGTRDPRDDGYGGSHPNAPGVRDDIPFAPVPRRI